MIIGIDGGALAIDDDRLKVGVYKITLRLMEYFSHTEYSNNYRIYTFKRIGESDRHILGSNIEERILLPSKGWQKIRLPLELQMHLIDVFLGLSQMIPHSMSHNVGFIYDLGFLHFPDDYPGSLKGLIANTQYLVDHSDTIITISESTKADILAHYNIPSDKITVCYPGIDTQFRSIGPKIIGDHPYFLFVGALKKGKNIPALVKAYDAFRNISKTRYNLLLVGGNYWPDPEINNLIRSLNLESFVHQTGFVSDDELAKYYRGASAYISLAEHEGFSLTAVEAMASGIPLIVADRGAVGEITKGAAMQVNPENIQEAAHLMRKVLEPNTRDKLVRGGRSVSKKYSWEKFGSGVQSVINRYAKI